MKRLPHDAKITEIDGFVKSALNHGFTVLQRYHPPMLVRVMTRFEKLKYLKN